MFIRLWVMATRDPPETSEYRIFRERYDILIQSIKDPLPLATRLFTQGVVTSAVKEHMSVVGLSTLDKSNVLLGAVEKQIQSDPQKFHVFLSVLNEDPSVQLLVESMQSKHLICEDITTSMHPPSSEKEHKKQCYALLWPIWQLTVSYYL